MEKIHKNNLWVSHANIANLLKNKSEGYELTPGMGRIVSFICPNCNQENKKRVFVVVNKGFSCSRCSDGISYPEKFMMNFLNQLKIDYEYQKTFDWSKKIKCDNDKLNGNKKYDFYINSLKCIIEVNGKQHYEENCYEKLSGKSLQDEKENDRLKEEISKNNGIKQYIVIDCRYSKLEYIKNSILNSKLAEVHNLNNVNWLKCHEFACSSLVKTTCELWDKYRNTSEIANILKMGKNTVIKYLKQGNEIGICKYNPKENKGSRKEPRKIIQLTLNDDFVKEFSCISEAAKEINSTSTSICSCCKGRLKIVKSYKWMYKEDFDQYIKQAN